MSGRRNGLIQCLPMLTALFFLTVMLSGCGQATDTSGLVGYWVLDGAESDSIVIPDQAVENNRISLRLDADGSGQISGDISNGRVRWSFDQGVLYLFAGSVKLSGYVKGEAILLRTEDENTLLRFVPETGFESAVEGNTNTAGAYLGDWYGWWKIEDSTGSMPVTWYDCCASFEERSDGTVGLILWDEDGSRKEPISEITFKVSEGGALMSLNGYFAYMEICKGDLMISEPDHAILLSEIPHRANGEFFYATVYLRPWGDHWEKMADEQRPFYYDDWYLPLIERNESMPDQIPWQHIEKNRTHSEASFETSSDRSK